MSYMNLSGGLYAHAEGNGVLVYCLELTPAALGVGVVDSVGGVTVLADPSLLVCYRTLLQSLDNLTKLKFL